jgi:hypothetical protein
VAVNGQAGAVLVGRRCNPYGAETGGPRRLLGGLYRGASAATPGMDLPAAVAEGEWRCEQPAQVRVRMVCEHGHTGQVMELCSWHDEAVFKADYVAGTFRQVRDTVRVRGHYEEIARRQSGFCPPCGFPDSRSSRNRIDYAALQKEWEANGQSLHALYYGPDRRDWYSPLSKSLQQRRDDIGRLFDEGRALGIIHNCPLRLVPVS